MTARTSRGVEIHIVRGGATPTELTATDATLAKPSTISVADTTGMVEGDIVVLAANSTSIPEIDGRSWIVNNITATSFDLVGSDAASSTGAFVAGDPIDWYAATDLIKLCLSGMTFNPESAETIGVGTYCDPTATLPSESVAAGTVDLTGYVDVTDTGYIELLEADTDRDTRIFRVTLPSNGYLMFTGILGGLNIQVPLDGAISYTASVALTTKPRHLF